LGRNILGDQESEGADLMRPEMLSSVVLKKEEKEKENEKKEDEKRKEKKKKKHCAREKASTNERSGWKLRW
jgi:hypothetical protein